MLLPKACWQCIVKKLPPNQAIVGKLLSVNSHEAGTCFELLSDCLDTEL